MHVNCLKYCKPLVIWIYVEVMNNWYYLVELPCNVNKKYFKSKGVYDTDQHNLWVYAMYVHYCCLKRIQQRYQMYTWDPIRCMRGILLTQPEFVLILFTKLLFLYLYENYKLALEK